MKNPLLNNQNSAQSDENLESGKEGLKLPLVLQVQVLRIGFASSHLSHALFIDHNLKVKKKFALGMHLRRQDYFEITKTKVVVVVRDDQENRL
jgi:hypothetical protein